MRFNLAILLFLILLLAGCAYEGTVVKKDFRPLPFPYSLGIDGIYKFELRDRAGHVHSQMVTPFVFASYEIGDYFNDLEALPPDASRKPPQLPVPDLPPPIPRTPEYEEIPNQPRRTTGISDAASAKKLAIKKHKKSHRKIARLKRKRRSEPT